MSDLKPCPFCGSENLEIHGNDADAIRHRAVCCYSCSAVGGRVTAKPMKGSVEQWIKMGELAVELWNTRPDIESAESRIATLETENASLRERVEAWREFNDSDEMCDEQGWVDAKANLRLLGELDKETRI